MSGISLKPLLAAIRDELESLDRERAELNRSPLLELQTLDLELKCIVETEGKTSGGIDVRIVSLGDSKTIRSESVQTIRLTYRIAQPGAKHKPLGSRLHPSADSQPESSGIDLLE